MKHEENDGDAGVPGLPERGAPGWRLTGKKPEGAIGPPGMPSFGGNCPSGLGAGPALCAIPFTP